MNILFLFISRLLKFSIARIFVQFVRKKKKTPFRNFLFTSYLLLPLLLLRSFDIELIDKSIIAFHRRVYRRTVTHRESSSRRSRYSMLVISVRIKRSGTVGSFRRSMHNRAATFKSASSIYDLSNDRYCTVTLGQGSCRDRIGISRPLTVTDLPRSFHHPSLSLFLSRPCL